MNPESKVELDINLFDGAQQQVVEYLAQGPYIKFFQSDIYINFLQVKIIRITLWTIIKSILLFLLQQNDISEVNSKTASGTHSSSSSVSGKTPGLSGSSSAPAAIHPENIKKATSTSSGNSGKFKFLSFPLFVVFNSLVLNLSFAFLLA